ncbi:hypothetical protein LOTGIDRAFT_218777 [Lottia gigantea]|uniref:Uncharacterized protein n=1 Tax=Lottia gigantea TaxID=225164 RepID=V4BLQ0_LOTGI|nr:hypothetical protein LOTGIDRAFT_218777 [Lottia gigantea]ESO89679.1 hypothetical protein LOTGIDRAFT_218777 [Lottia gigantea]
MSNSFDSENSDKSKDGEKSKNSLKKIVLKFADSTSMQGVPNVNAAKHWFPKTIWTLLLLASLGAMTLHLKFLFDTYYSWPKHSTVSLGFSTLEFPAITVCNVNPIRKSQLYLASPALRNIVDIADPGNIVRKLEEYKFPDENGMVPIPGMQLIVYLEDKEYIRGLTSGSGAQVVIHDRNTCPFPQNDGIAIASGTESNIGLRLVNVIRLGEPHGSCEEGNQFQEEYGYKYTRQSCHVFCLQNLISSRCGCYDEDEEELNIIANIQQKYSPCRNISELKCMVGVQADYENGKENCFCDNPCVETRFQYSLSSRQWPSDDYTKVLLTALCYFTKSVTSWSRQNFIKLNIYYEDLNYENITEEEDYETAQFISDVGGTVGLWIGLSILSIFELVELVVRILHFITFFMWCRTRSSTDKKSPDLPRHHRPEPNG